MIMITSIPILVAIESHLGQSNWSASTFHVVSASTTTGFQFLNLSEFTIESKLLLILLMLIGGCAFSTAGGIKIARLIFIFQKLFHREEPPPKEKYMASMINDHTSRKTIALPSIISIKYLTNSSFIDAFFESVSASTNTGLSIGITNVELDSVSKSILITNMIMGRFEIITIPYIFINFLRR